MMVEMQWSGRLDMHPKGQENSNSKYETLRSLLVESFRLKVLQTCKLERYSWSPFKDS